MTLDGHLKTGLAAAICATAYCLTQPEPLPTELMFAFVIALFVGNVFPDFSEMGVIPHRTFTHYWPIYGVIIVACYILLPNPDYALWAYVGLGVSIGSLMHILCDWPYYGGIPVFTPRRKVPLLSIEFGGVANRVIEHSVMLLLIIAAGMFVFSDAITFTSINTESLF